MNKILPGENRLLRRDLTLADKVTPLPVASLDSAEVVLMQDGKMVAAYVLGLNDELRADPVAPAALVLEITSELSGKLGRGPVQEQWTLVRENAEFVAEPGRQIDRINLSDFEIG